MQRGSHMIYLPLRPKHILYILHTYMHPLGLRAARHSAKEEFTALQSFAALNNGKNLTVVVGIEMFHAYCVRPPIEPPHPGISQEDVLVYMSHNRNSFQGPAFEGSCKLESKLFKRSCCMG